MTPNWWTVLPVRGFATGKSRLAALLDAPSRAALNRYLLAHTLEVIEQWRGDLRQCLVVSPCEQALAYARDAGAQVLREPAGGDLNRALELGAAHAVLQRAKKLLIVACDLPDLSAAALAALTELAANPESAALAPDRAGSGTNALAVEAQARDIFHFGANSCERHSIAFARAGYRRALCRRAELAFDLDTPQHYAEWSARCRARIPRGFAQSGQLEIAEAEK